MDQQQEKRMKLIRAGAWLREARHGAGYSQKDFADAVGMDQSQLSKCERGISEVTDERAEDMAGALKKDIIDVRRGLELWVPANGLGGAAPTLQDYSTQDLMRELGRRFRSGEIEDRKSTGS